MSKSLAIIMFILGCCFLSFNSSNYALGVNKNRQIFYAFVEQQIGVEEIPRGSNRGPMVDKYVASTGLDPKGEYPWCAAVINYCVINSQANPQTPKYPARAASWFPKERLIRYDDVLYGDMAGFYYPSLKRIGHIGIVESINKGVVRTKEGNTNDDGSREGYIFCNKKRLKSQIKCYSRWIKD